MGHFTGSENKNKNLHFYQGHINGSNLSPLFASSSIITRNIQKMCRVTQLRDTFSQPLLKDTLSMSSSTEQLQQQSIQAGVSKDRYVISS